MEDFKFEIDGIEYGIPKYITIEMYQNIFKIKDVLTDEYFAAKLIHIVTGCPLETILETDYEQVSFISGYIMNLIPRVDTDFKDRFELDGVNYGFLPNWRKLNFAEYIDIDTISSKGYEEILKNLHVLAAMYYRPIVKERSQHDFDIEPYSMDGFDERVTLFQKKMDVSYVLGAQFFFTKSAEKSSSHIPQYLTMSTWEKVKWIWKFRKVIKMMGTQLLKEDSDGTQYSIDLSQTILRNTIKSYRKPWWKRSINWFTSLLKKKKS